MRLLAPPYIHRPRLGPGASRDRVPRRHLEMPPRIPHSTRHGRVHTNEDDRRVPGRRQQSVWSEPLAASTIDTQPNRYQVRVTQGDGSLVAALRIDWRGNRATCGELRVLDANGGPRQKRRALVLLLRAALHHAQDLGVQYGTVLVMPAMQDIAERLAGRQAQIVNSDGASFFTGEIAEWRTRALEVSDADGNMD